MLTLIDVNGIERSRLTSQLNISPAIVNELNKKGLLQDSNGAKIVDLSEHNLGACLIRKSDGSSLYATRDLAACDDRYNNYNFFKSFCHMFIIFTNK